MAFFKKLFEKKECSICGGEIGLLGNRKLEDGNMCKTCAGKLSPWFEDRRESTVAEINEQLAYREANKEQVAAFHTTRVYGEFTKLYLDEDARKLIVTSSAEKDWEETNPDVISFDEVIGCDTDVTEGRREITYADKEGKQVSYNPPRYTYYYDFKVEISVRNPYFDTMNLKLNRSSVEIDSQAPRRMSSTGAGRFISGSHMGINPELNVEYREYKAMGEEIKEVLLNARQQVRDEQAAANAPKIAVTCPYCGATTTPNESGCCEFCGGAVNG